MTAPGSNGLTRPAPFSVDIDIHDLYMNHYRPARHPGDNQRGTVGSYLGDIDRFSEYFQFLCWQERFNSPPRNYSVAELFADFDWWRKHCDRPPRRVQLADACDELMVAAMNIRVELGWRRSTANKMRRSVNAILNWSAKALKKRGVLIDRPDTEKYREDVNQPIAFMPDELERIFAACSRQEGRVGVVQASLWWTMCVAFIHAGGLRIGAARKVPTAKLDLMRGGMWVPSTAQKNRHEKWLDFFPSTIRAIRDCRIIERKVKFVLGDFPFNTDTLRRHFAKILVEAEIFPSVEDVPRELKFHALRKTLASQIYAATGSLSLAQKRMDHQSIETTKRYIDARYDRENPITEMLDDPLGPQTPPAKPTLRIADCG